MNIKQIAMILGVSVATLLSYVSIMGIILSLIITVFKSNVKQSVFNLVGHRHFSMNICFLLCFRQHVYPQGVVDGQMPKHFIITTILINALHDLFTVENIL